MKTIKGYKFIHKNMKSKNGNHKWELNKWYKCSKLELCNQGFHACKTPLDSLNYVYGDKWFIIESRGKIINGGDKFVASEMRLIKELPINFIVKRFAIFCAKDCIKNYEVTYPNDKRPANAIRAAEDYLDKKIKLTELKEKINVAESAAWSARSAAWSAESAAWSAESAVVNAARSARSAARSARSAAWSARSAAWSAGSAESAAWSAGRERQNRELLRLIKEFS